MVSRVMSANRATNSKPEIALRKKLWAAGLRGYRLHYKKAPGRPDISFVSKKLALFVHGCYWHRCPVCNYPLPKNNRDFWKVKFDQNRIRDKRKTRDLQNLGWKVLTIWECELQNELNSIITKIKKSLICPN